MNFPRQGRDSYRHTAQIILCYGHWRPMGFVLVKFWIGLCAHRVSLLPIDVSLKYSVVNAICFFLLFWEFNPISCSNSNIITESFSRAKRGLYVLLRETLAFCAKLFTSEFLRKTTLNFNRKITAINRKWCRKMSNTAIIYSFTRQWHQLHGSFQSFMVIQILYFRLDVSERAFCARLYACAMCVCHSYKTYGNLNAYTKLKSQLEWTVCFLVMNVRWELEVDHFLQTTKYYLSSMLMGANK